MYAVYREYARWADIDFFCVEHARSHARSCGSHSYSNSDTYLDFDLAMPYDDKIRLPKNQWLVVRVYAL
jgi:hypothetical protein